MLTGALALHVLALTDDFVHAQSSSSATATTLSATRARLSKRRLLPFRLLHALTLLLVKLNAARAELINSCPYCNVNLAFPAGRSVDCLYERRLLLLADGSNCLCRRPSHLCLFSVSFLVSAVN